MLKLQFTSKAAEMLKQETRYQGFCQVEQLSLRHRLFQGGWSPSLQREVIKQCPVVAVLLVDPDRRQVVLIEQFRPGAWLGMDSSHAKVESPWLIEIVAGMVEANESFDVVARREVQEEAGVTISALLPIYNYWVSPAVSTQRMSVFCGRVDASLAGGTHGLAEEGEDIKVHVVALQKIYDYLAQGKIYNAPTLIALQWLQLNEATLIKQWQSGIITA